MKKIFFIFPGVLILLICFFLTQKMHPGPTVTIDHQTFILEVAKTQQEQEIGLAKYITLPQNKAMYFPFEKADYYAFWMKGMHFPIDLLFLRRRKIITIFHSIQSPMPNQSNLPLYQPTSPSDSVLEMNAGLSKKYGFKIGDNVIIVF